MKRHKLTKLSMILAALAVAGCSSSEPAEGTQQPAAKPSVIRVGAASSPKYGAVFDAMKRDFERSGQAFEYTLYTNYFKLVDALLAGEVDIAWNTPMAHARAMQLTDGGVIGPIARDVDIQYAADIVVRKDSGIETIEDLVGKKMALGSIESAELNALPRYYLEQEGLDIDTEMTVLDLDGLVDDQMTSISTASYVIEAVTLGNADAGAVGEKTTRAIPARGSAAARVRPVRHAGAALRRPVQPPGRLRVAVAARARAQHDPQ